MRPIDADELLKEINDVYNGYMMSEQYAPADFERRIEEAPTVEMVPAEKWISVTERLPEEKTAVLLSCDDMYLAKLNPCIGWISGNNWYTFSARGSYLVKYPIAWMPLPKPYKGGE